MNYKLKDGFTLLEILITTVVVTVGVAVLVGLFGSGLVGSTDAENTTIAMNLAQRRMEEIKNLDFDTGIDDEPKEDVNIDVDGDGVNDFPGFQREVVVTEPETDLKQVQVFVYWTFKGEEVNVGLVTYVSKD